MAEQSQFGKMPDPTPPGGLRCEEWEVLLADALDGLLPAREAAAFHAHSAGCPGCADLLAHAKQGQEWLVYLHHEPDVPSGLVSRILDKTAGAGAIPIPVLAGQTQGVGAAAIALPQRRSFHETRLLMTVAMAFFSIAITLNMANVKLTSLHLADLRPSALSSTLSRQFYGARGSVVRFYNNMRFVYQLESKVRELRRDAEQAPAAPSKPAPSKQSNKNGSLNSGPARGEVLNAGQHSAVTHPRSEFHELSTHIDEGTEADHLISLGTHRAGPRRQSETAGYEGRSLA